MKRLFEYIECLSEGLAISWKIQLTSHLIVIFLLEAPHFPKTPDIRLKINW